MNLDLNEFLSQIFFWKSVSRKKDEEIKSLQKQLLFANKQNEVLENSHHILLHEIAELNMAVTILRNSFSNIEEYEASQKISFEEKQRLKISLESLEKLYNEQKKNAKQEQEIIKERNKEETTKLLCLTKDKVSKQLQNLQNVLEEKEKLIKNLNEEIAIIMNEKHQDTLKLRIQYEDKIGKLKQQIPKSKLQSPSGLQMHDIFRQIENYVICLSQMHTEDICILIIQEIVHKLREYNVKLYAKYLQKYLKLEKKSNEEIAKLKDQIKALEYTVDNMKSKNINSSLNLAPLTRTQQDLHLFAAISTNMSDMSKQAENKLVKPDNDFLTKEKTELKTSQKRKLFNLNENYFVK